MVRGVYRGGHSVGGVSVGYLEGDGLGQGWLILTRDCIARSNGVGMLRGFESCSWARCVMAFGPYAKL